MKLLVLSVHDAASRAWLQPFYARSLEEARRMMVDTCADPTTSFSKHPKDFRMYHLGEFDDATGSIEVHSVPELVCSAEDCIPGPLFREVAE